MVATPKSPNYPGIDLGTAIELAILLYDSVGKGEFTPMDAAKAWNHKSPSGPVRSRIGTLRQYGLIEGKRGRNAENPKLARRALTFVLREKDSREYQDAVREAALTPPLFRELHNSHPNAADGVVQEFLIVDKNFTADGAQRFITAYKKTLKLAKFDKFDLQSDLDHVESPNSFEKKGLVSRDHEQGTVNPVSPSTPEGSIAIPVPLDAARMATITVPIDMQDSDWMRIDRILKAYKPPEKEV